LLSINALSITSRRDFAQEPMTDVGRASRRRAGKKITPFAVRLNIDLPPGEDAITDHADALVVERIPLSRRVGCFQDCEPLFRRKVRWHHRLAVRSLGSGKAGVFICFWVGKQKKTRIKDVKIVPLDGIAIGAIQFFAATSATI
jgi:hypothetical protein